MIYLSLTILCSVLLGFIFKLFSRFGIDGFQAIVFNYFTCFACGWMHLGHFPIKGEYFQQSWMPYALTLGFIFVSGFNLAAMTVWHFGVTVGQIMQKMSILMTVPFAILAYHESANPAKIFGFLAALAAIILVNWPEKSAENKEKSPLASLWWIPVGTWVLAGLLEVLLVSVKHQGLTDMNDPTFIITIFGTAGVLGFILALIGWLSGRLQFSWKNVAAGVILGVPNYGSMLFMLFALAAGLEGSFVFPTANVSIIALTTLGAVLLFREKLSALNWAGIALALVALGLIV